MRYVNYKAPMVPLIGCYRGVLSPGFSRSRAKNNHFRFRLLHRHSGVSRAVSNITAHQMRSHAGLGQHSQPGRHRGTHHLWWMPCRSRTGLSVRPGLDFSIHLLVKNPNAR
jgi:hypothetical protein